MAAQLGADVDNTSPTPFGVSGAELYCCPGAFHAKTGILGASPVAALLAEADHPLLGVSGAALRRFAAAYAKRRPCCAT